MSWIYKIFRAIIVTMIVLSIFVPITLFIILSIPSAQNQIKTTAEKRLTELIEMKVKIGGINIAPFSRISLKHVIVSDSLNDTVLTIEKLGASINISDLFLKNKIVLNYAELIGLDANISRENRDSELNIQPLINAFSKNNSDKASNFNLRINTIVIRKSSVAYNVYSEPYDSNFSPDHISISDLRADIRIPIISNDIIDIKLKRLAFFEQSGLNITDLNVNFYSGPDSINIKNLNLAFPNSNISFSDVKLDYGLKQLQEEIWKDRISVRFLESSHIFLPDFAFLLPFLGKIPFTFELNGGFDGNLQSININNFNISTNQGSYFNTSGFLEKSSKHNGSFDIIDLPKIELNVNKEELEAFIEKTSLQDINPLLKKLIGNLQYLNLTGSINILSNKTFLYSKLLCNAGEININSEFSENIIKHINQFTNETTISVNNFNFKEISNNIGGIYNKIGSIDANIYANLIYNDYLKGDIIANIEKINFNNCDFSNISGNFTFKDDLYNLQIESSNPGLDLILNADVLLAQNNIRIDANSFINDFDYTLATQNRNKPESLSADINIALQGDSYEDLTGIVDIKDFTLSQSEQSFLFNEIKVKNISIQSERDSMEKIISLNSDIIDGTLKGKYKISSLIGNAQNLISSLVPAIENRKSTFIPNINQNSDSAVLNLTLKTTSPLGDSYKLPLGIVYPINIKGYINSDNKDLKLSLIAPYIQQKGKLLENTEVSLDISDDNHNLKGYFHLNTFYPTKKGIMSLNFNSYTINNNIDSHLSWKVDRERDFHGDLDISTYLSKSANSENTDFKIKINPSEIVFNDTVWSVSPGTIIKNNKIIAVDNLRIGRDNQYISFNGNISDSQDDKLNILLRKVNLGYIFETLDIETAMFGGIASGDFIASQLLSETPIFYTSGLDVERLSYNNSLMGDTHVLSKWEPNRKAINIDAIIQQPNGLSSKVKGDILPFSDSLDFQFDADKIEIGFMLPYMQAFTSEVSGFASGKARLWGNFKYIDMVGTIYAEDVKLKLDFTNTSYIATDTIYLSPGHIALDNITLRDTEGKTALLNGYIDHEFFKKPKFEFNITNANDLLVYNIAENLDTRWFGKIYANGSATVTGLPGIVNIGVNMSTAPQSTFTFVLSDAEEAYEYNFITFRDREQSKKDSLNSKNKTPDIIKELKGKINKSEEQGSGSVYNMNIAVDVNPSALVNIIMDPIAGDRIKAYGNGNIRMTYDSSNEDFKMFGAYTLTRGNYNFTLQDIIIKDFTIRDGSTITFHGDPYAASLDIEAIYSVNANLSDLDESFLQDKELNRTNVPVHALLKVSGDIRQPDISFDLEFPTLTQDTYRKVRSIVSTEEMMNRQIIYLLALSRFYTPDYMTTTKGNELVSVASSTISSQLSNILGQLSENWSISPNFRSDKGDFSDVEVDLALSSSLLNNRLLLNGNFGYRDKTLNNNTFIGDFDIEYLLNRTGSIRLKAYNRYNDRNYYLKSALTTQGAGIVFKKDFDNIFSFLKRNKSNIDKGDPKIEDDSITGPTIILNPIPIDNDTFPADTILNKGRFEIDFDIP